MEDYFDRGTPDKGQELVMEAKKEKVKDNYSTMVLTYNCQQMIPRSQQDKEMENKSSAWNRMSGTMEEDERVQVVSTFSWKD